MRVHCLFNGLELSIQCKQFYTQIIVWDRTIGLTYFHLLPITKSNTRCNVNDRVKSDTCKNTLRFLTLRFYSGANQAISPDVV